MEALMRLALSSSFLMFAVGVLAASPVELVRLTDLSTAAQQSIRENFVAHNPASAWQAKDIRLAPKQGFVAAVVVPARGDEPTAAEAERIALEFVAHNAAFLGVDAAALPKLTAKYAPSLLQNVVVEARGLSYPGYENFPAFTYDVNVLMQVKGGAVRLLINRSTRLPFNLPELKTTPALTSNDAAIQSQLIGRELKYHDFGGRLRSAGKITEADIQSVKLVIAQEYVDNALVVTLAWRFDVKRSHLPWTLYFSAHDGKLVALRQNFAT